MSDATTPVDNPKAKDSRVEKKVVVAVCGHENKHYLPPKPLAGKKLICTLEQGHQPVLVKRTGPKGEDMSTYEVVHSAPYQILRGESLEDGVAHWSDAAGTPLPKELIAKHK